MRIVYIHQYFNTPEMSGGTRSYEMARRMVKAGHQVTIITSWRVPDRQPGTWFQTSEAGIDVHWYVVPYSNHMSYIKRTKAFFAYALAARGKAREFDCDVIFATSTPLTVAIPAVGAAKKRKVPLVFEVRDLWPELPIAMGALKNPMLRWAARKLELWAYKNSETVIALSPGMRDGVVKTGYPENRVAVIPNSSDNLEFAFDKAKASEFRGERPWLGNRPLLVYAGTFGRINGVEYLVRLAAELLELAPETRILLVGDGQELNRVKELARTLEVYEKNVFFERKMPKTEIPSLLSAATMACSLFIDVEEMQPNSANKFFDALASGTPILINYGGWQQDLVQRYSCGLTLRGRSIREAAEIVASRMDDHGWIDTAGHAARRLAETQFDRDLLGSQLEEVLRATAKGETTNVAAITNNFYPVGS